MARRRSHTYVERRRARSCLLRTFLPPPPFARRAGSTRETTAAPTLTHVVRERGSAHRSEANAGYPRRGQGAGKVGRDHDMPVEARNPKDLHAFGHLVGNDPQVLVRGDVVRRMVFVDPLQLLLPVSVSSASGLPSQ